VRAGATPAGRFASRCFLWVVRLFSPRLYISLAPPCRRVPHYSGRHPSLLAEVPLPNGGRALLEGGAAVLQLQLQPTSLGVPFWRPRLVTPESLVRLFRYVSCVCASWMLNCSYRACVFMLALCLADLSELEYLKSSKSYPPDFLFF
jgi:hypothetical protein